MNSAPSSSNSQTGVSAALSTPIAPAPPATLTAVPVPAAAPAPSNSNVSSASASASDRGHVFILNGDILQIACDAVGISSKGWLRACTWFQALPADIKVGLMTSPSPRGPLEHITASVRDKLPSFVPEIFNITLGGTDTDWFLQRTSEFIETAANAVKAKPPKFGRAKHLILLPAYGVRYGGGKAYAGPIVEGIMKQLYSAIKVHNMDFALVSNEQAVYQAALTVRSRSIPRDIAYSEADLSRESRQLSKALVQHAQQEELVIFLGAGCSVAAGLPQWGQLLEDLAKLAGMPEPERTNLWKLNHLDQARIIEKRLGGSEKLTAAVRDRIEGTMVAPIHALLQALPGVEAVTTNYDTLYERAVVAAGKSISVLPYQDTKGTTASRKSKWLLKMHGCVSKPQDIVLTREDYIRYNERRQALAGIVQALMLTKHMLFVGFSLSDTNFLNIASTVKKALASRHAAGRQSHFGTALQLIQNPLLDELWEGDIQMINMEPSIDKPASADWARAARRAEIFLDYCVGQSLSRAATNHLMDPTYSVLLSDSERQLANRLQQFLNDLPRDARNCPAFKKIATVIDDLGGDPQSSRPPRSGKFPKKLKNSSTGPLMQDLEAQLEQKRKQLWAIVPNKAQPTNSHQQTLSSTTSTPLSSSSSSTSTTVITSPTSPTPAVGSTSSAGAVSPTASAALLSVSTTNSTSSTSTSASLTRNTPTRAASPLSASSPPFLPPSAQPTSAPSVSSALVTQPTSQHTTVAENNSNLSSSLATPPAQQIGSASPPPSSTTLSPGEQEVDTNSTLADSSFDESSDEESSVDVMIEPIVVLSGSAELEIPKQLDRTNTAISESPAPIPPAPASHACTEPAPASSSDAADPSVASRGPKTP